MQAIRSPLAPDEVKVALMEAIAGLAPGHYILYCYYYYYCYCYCYARLALYLSKQVNISNNEAALFLCKGSKLTIGARWR